ncbi:hypothetical protein [Anaerosporobacter sp.]|nr:hypothetical protein [Anaerosporobacter sp.]
MRASSFAGCLVAGKDPTDDNFRAVQQLSKLSNDELIQATLSPNM